MSSAFPPVDTHSKSRISFHSEGPNRFSCEFCGKDRFNRRDNLDAHRRRHAEPGSRGRVEFIPASVPVIEQEELSRRRRIVTKSKNLARKAVNPNGNYGER